MLLRLHTILYDEVGAAVQPLAQQETTWSQGEMVKRIVRYIYKSASSDELLTLPWQGAVSKFVQGAMGSYGGSCGERPWFYDLELGPVFGRAAWEVLTSSEVADRPSYGAVLDVAEQEFQSWLDQTLQNKAMWIAVEESFADTKTQNKVFVSLQKTYRTALDLVLRDTRYVDDELSSLKEFMKKWMEDSLARSWSAIGDSVERILTEDVCNHLFWKLIAPFGEAHPFSCIPSVLMERIGRPPHKWGFIPNTVRGIFRSWYSQTAAGPAAKRRKKAAARDLSPEPPALPPAPASAAAPAAGAARRGRRAQAPVEVPPPPAEEEDMEDDEPEPLPVEEDVEEVEPEEAEVDEEEDGDFHGHPDCTSQEDCHGSPDDVLIRHILNGKEADIYCASCWHTFKMSNHLLEGVEVGS